VSASASVPGRLSIVSGPPLDAISWHRRAGRVDELCRLAAHQAGSRCAIRSPAGDLSYAELDTLVSRCASGLTALTGSSAAVVGVAAVLDPAFAIAYYGVARSGNVSAIVNPFLKADGLAHVLRTSEAEVAIVTPELLRTLLPLRGQLPRLRHLVLITTDRTAGAAGAPVLADLAARNLAGPGRGGGPDDLACILFTSGTTGAPKAVPLTHQNLIVNAAQMIHAHDIGGTSVMLNYLPTFHLMHLNAATTATATQVLYHGDDVAGSIRVANQQQVTHFHSMPMRLSRLAADPHLDELALRTTRALFSGGSALPPQKAARLSRHFGIPVVQGYGLAEASPLTHLDPMSAPRPGSCGLPVAGTECRVVDVDTREVVPIGVNGEIEVRGPQVMTGYLAQEHTQEIADGWFSTGDVGHIDADGYLFIADRLKDVFKCDNYLVSPTEIESILRQHPSIADCVVVDYPDEFSGAVAYGLAVLRGEADTAEVVRFVNAKVPHYMQLRRLLPVPEIPRSHNGKIQRRELRASLREMLTGEEPAGVVG
jgi:long-chain acyl-CoA synthetase